MAMTKAEKAAQAIESLERLQEWKDEILEPSSVLEFRTEYGTGQTDYVSVHLYYQRDGVGHTNELTYHVGYACGYSFRRSEYRHQLALGGGNYSKSYDVAISLFSKLGIDSKDVNFRYRP